MGSLGGNGKLELPKVYMSGLHLAKQDSKAWVAAREKIAWALANYGAFEVIFDLLQPKLREELIQNISPDVFLKETEFTTALNEPNDGLWKKKLPHVSLKSFRVMEPTSLASVQDCTKAVWPQGNDFFCNTIWDYSKEMQGLIQMIHRMILESLGLEDHYEKHMESVAHALRLTKYYKDLSDESIEHGIPSHMDPNYISIVCQHDNEGLEVETLDGEWIRISTTPNSYTVLLGEVYSAWTNGKLQAANHRVKIDGTADRYSITYNSFPCYNDDMVRVPDELVDEKNPLLFKPFRYRDYMKFCHSEESAKYKYVLKAFCGV